MYVYCLYWFIADEHDAYYLVHKEKFTEEQFDLNELENN